MDGTGDLVVKEYAHIVAGEVGPALEEYARGVRRIDGRGCLALPGLVNCDHLDQWTTHGLAGRKKEVPL